MLLLFFVAIQRVLDRIESLTEFKFFVNIDEVNVDERVSVKVQNKTIDKVLVQSDLKGPNITELRRLLKDHKIVKEWQKRYPASKSYDMKIVARTHDMRNKVIET